MSFLAGKGHYFSINVPVARNYLSEKAK